MLNATNKNTLKSIVVLFVLLCILMSFRTTAEKTSKYRPRPIETQPVSEKSIFELENSLKCAPGNPGSGYYSSNKTPGGVCGDQKVVSDSADAQIVGGIGGSLI